MLRSASERAELNEELDSIEPFWHRKLRYNKKEYRRSIDELDQQDLINWVTMSPEFASLFCVWKKNGVSRRLMMDVRRANRALQLLSSEDFSRWEVPSEYAEEAHVELAVTDIDNCFHCSRMSVELSVYFCLQPLPLKYTTTDRGHSLARKEALTSVWPALASLPMGFVWSLFLAQRAAETVHYTPLCPPPALVHDRSRPVVLTPGGPPRHFVYVDNIGQTTEVMDGVCEVMEVRSS